MNVSNIAEGQRPQSHRRKSVVWGLPETAKATLRLVKFDNFPLQEIQEEIRQQPKDV
jgi:hypothetical protein